ncbi:MAG: formylglycine-generating enzyme family protein [Candidatus Krumholzibacteriota bacterium]|nr:formylglycine-generating enzyme family protein [Candidatus Krumholzibacteriota bacterium]
MKSGSRRSDILVIVALALFVFLAGCRDDPTKPDPDKEDPPEGFVAISEGSFTMGSPEDEPDRVYDETQHTVVLTKRFFISTNEITNQQYAELAQWAYGNDYCNANAISLRDFLDGSTEKLMEFDDEDCEISFNDGIFTVESGKEDHPVKEVTWYGAVAYCDWLSLREEFTRAYDHVTWQCNGNDPYEASGYRLPTEAEWEYACRAGTLTPFNTGNCLEAGTEANYNGNFPYSDCSLGSFANWSMPVGSYPANSFDLRDLHGNILEWCNDWFGIYEGNETDPVGAVSGTLRVLRGGDWHTGALNCRSAKSGRYSPLESGSFVGFRPVRSIN